MFTELTGVSLVMLVINNALRMYGGDSADLAISAYGVINRIAEFTLLPVFGVMQGLQPVVGFNFGAGKIERTRKALKLAVAVSAPYGVTIFLSAQRLRNLSCDYSTPIPPWWRWPPPPGCSWFCRRSPSRESA